MFHRGYWPEAALRPPEAAREAEVTGPGGSDDDGEPPGAGTSTPSRVGGICDKPGRKATSRVATQGPPGTSAESYYHLLVAAICRSWRPVSVALLTTRMR